jgi:RNA polymerase sigma factor (sigma-70 family)
MSDATRTVGSRGDLAAREEETADWARRAASGDRTAWNALVDRFGGLVWAIARGSGLRPADAADVSQTVWLRLVEHLDRIENPGRVGAWLATTTKRECIRLRSRGDRQIPVGDAWLFDTEEEERPRPVDHGMLLRERDDLLRQAVAALPERARTLLTLLVAEPSLSYADVSSILEMPIGSIGPTRARVLTQLRRNAERLGIVATDADPHV